MKRSRLLLAVLGIALSTAAVYVLLRQVGTRDLVRNIRGADPLWLAGACLLTVAGYWLRAARWGEILSPEAKVGQGRLFATTMVGFLAINTLPARLGELVRAYALARSERINTGTVLGSVVIERIFDLAALAGFWALSLLFAPYPSWFRWSGYVTIALSVAVTVGLSLLHASHYDADSLASRLRRFVPKRLLEPIERPVASFAAGLRVLGKPSTIAVAGLLTLAMWIVTGSVFLLVGRSMGLSLPLWSPFLLSFVVCVAIMVPSSPGFIGVLEASCVAGLALLGVDASRALAYGVLYHLTQIVPLVLLGGFYAMRGRLGPGRLNEVS
ncbi:MAG TPA: lysylphosphatidylglycerol synthase transmembrane domain-containing protein [Methylomirabilota bacterium]|nr:lysylphosphatidylglycerol synthase transmembrane domain-containing protein [Methylomirabilota bacterium]